MAVRLDSAPLTVLRNTVEITSLQFYTLRSAIYWQIYPKGNRETVVNF